MKNLDKVEEMVAKATKAGPVDETLLEAISGSDPDGDYSACVQHNTDMLNERSARRRSYMRTTFVGAFRCAGCGSFVKERLQMKHREAFKEKVVAGTAKCYDCKHKEGGEE